MQISFMTLTLCVKYLTSSVMMMILETRPSKMEVSPWSFGLSKSLLLIKIPDGSWKTWGSSKSIGSSKTIFSFENTFGAYQIARISPTPYQPNPLDLQDPPYHPDPRDPPDPQDPLGPPGLLDPSDHPENILITSREHPDNIWRTSWEHLENI